MVLCFTDFIGDDESPECIHRLAGCVHTARIFRNSSLFTKAKAWELFSQDHHIFGKNAYPLRNWLLRTLVT